MMSGKKAACGALLRVLIEPGATLARLREAPHVLVPLSFIACLNVLYSIMTLPAVRSAALLQMEEMGSLPQEQLEFALKAMNVGVPVGAAVTSLLMPLGLALVLLLVGQFTEGDASFKSLLCLAGYSMVPSLLKGAITAVLSLVIPARDFIYITTSLALVLPREQVGTTLYRVFSFMDPFSWWSVYLLVVGYAIFNGFPIKKSTKIILTLCLLYMVASFFLLKKVSLGFPA